ncbi:diguanylate cyclase [Cereibacter azotoformans]|uniref:PAS domain S-box-containing protein/diguanylate cyclase (GGDEF)-like protein n=1 Tax=Cereibacter azotoformans TaxID=43057 RepID=A0A2T5JT73_9RHOB|nr:diguanylate cyclase [Cereibacter azotoformans]PTR13381.1 PAS domain S-box-containing protein/diguanylate cyclase (GGDEF)-like protein [Cereibacter azotoformans]
MDITHCFIGLSLDSAVYVMGATLAGFMLLASWLLRQGGFFGRAHFLTCIFGMIWWLGAASLELAVPDLSCKIAFATAAWPAIALVPICWFFFLRHYCFDLRRRSLRTEAFFIAGLVGLVTFMAATNPWHGLFYLPGTRLGILHGRTSGIFEHGPLFYAAAALLYVFLMSAVAITILAAFQANPIMRPTLMMMMFGTLVPLAANLAYVTLGTTLFGFDPTPFAFAFILLVFTWAIYANRSFDIATLARDLIYFSLSDPVLVLDSQGRIAGMNPAARKLLPDLVLGEQPRKTGPLATLCEVLEKGEKGMSERRWMEIQGRMFDIRLLPMRLPLGGRNALLGTAAIMTDTTELHRNAERLEEALGQSRTQLVEISRLRETAERLALSDPLTGLGNRRALRVAFETARAQQATLGIALIDLDHFKQINDRFGHAVGDRVLSHFATAMIRTMPEGTRAFRVGGEEFLMLCPGFDRRTMVELTERLAQRAADTPSLRNSDPVQPTFSAGIAISPEDGETLDQLHAQADIRLYEAKRSGRNRIMYETGSLPMRKDASEPFIAQEREAWQPLDEDPHGPARLAQRLSEGQRLATPLMRALMRATGSEVDAAIDQALAELGAHCRADRAYVFRIEDGMCSNTHEWCRAGIPPERHSLQRLPLEMIEPWLALLQDDMAVDIPDVAALQDGDPIRAHLARQGIHALVAVPLTDGTALTGFVGFDAVRPRPPFDPGERALLRAIADAIGASLARQDAETTAILARTAAKAAERNLHRLARVTEVMTNLVAVLDTELRVVWVNRAFEVQTGYRLADVVGRDFGTLIRGPQTDPAAVAAVQAAVDRRDSHEGETLNYDVNGQPYWIRFNIHPLYDADGTYAGYVSIETVISDRKALERELEAHNALLTGVLRTSVSAIVATDAAERVIYANAEAQRILDLVPAPDDPRTLLIPDWPLETLEGEPVERTALPSALVTATGQDQHDLRYAVRLPDGSRRVLSINAAPLPAAPQGARIVLSLTDITAAEASAEQLRRLAAEDPLTGLVNRRALRADLLARLDSDPGRPPLALIMLDLDNFKSVNDTMRHEAGDRALRVLAGRLREAARPQDLVARMGGDEFMLLAPGLEREDAVALAERLRRAVARPIGSDRQPINLTASTGIALSPAHGTTMSVLMTGADIALHAAKSRGRNQTVVLSQELFAAEERRSAIGQALAGTGIGRLRLVYQPQFALDATNRLTGAEALVRWTDPVLGEVRPDEFIPLAEETGLILNIDTQVLTLATRQLAQWARRGWRHRLAVNVSAQSFARADFGHNVLECLSREQVDPRLLVIELTETSLIAQSETATRNSAALREAGIGIAIDDYGTGYASLSYLHRMEVSEIKIDQSFVAGLDSGESRHSGPLIQAILGLARTLGMATTAEGVETEAQREWLRSAGCDRIQGYLSSPPLPPQIFEATYVSRPEDRPQAASPPASCSGR